MRSPTKGLFALLVPVVASLFAASGCIEDVEIGAFAASGAGQATSGGTSAGTTGAGGEVSGGAAGAASSECRPVACLGKVFACGDCVDNDGDGAVDAFDTQCLGACDDTEDSFSGGLPGQNNAPCRQDCYFDLDTGSGNDDCYYDHACDTLSVAPDYPPSGDPSCEYDEDTKLSGTSATCGELRAGQSEVCIGYCKPLVPNGCDCFGCCEIPARSGRFVFAGSTIDGSASCSQETLDDPAACKPCTPVPSCFERCDTCDICVGELAPGPGCGSDDRCGGEVPPCGADVAAACPADSYCVTGCCIPVPR